MQFGLLASGQAAQAALRPQSQASATTIRSVNNVKESPLACNMNALTAAQRQEIHTLLQQFGANRQGVKELPNGYAVRLPAQGTMIQDAARYITLERLCCPFFDFALEAEREGGPIWLTLTGREGVKEFAKIEFGLRETIATAAASPETTKESPLTCNDGALSAMQGPRLGSLVNQFRANKQEVKELKDGYAIRLSGEAATITDVGDFMALVRLCSPYFETALEVECEGGPVWLKVTGRTGVKALVKEEFKL
jgi:hypothetical protein